MTAGTVLFRPGDACSLAFRRIDARLADWLMQASRRESQIIRHTHQEVAGELGTAREVISRQLKEFERQGLLSPARGRIEVTDPARLRRIAALSDRTGTGVT